MKPIELNDILKDRAKYTDLSPDLKKNLDHILEIANKIQTSYGKPIIITSGYRRPEDNAATSNASKTSAHLVCQAIDVFDPNGDVMRWVLANLQLMKDLGVYMEDFRWCSNWVHFGTRKPSSGHRIFVPSSATPAVPNKWDGKYDNKYNDHT